MAQRTFTTELGVDMPQEELISKIIEKIAESSVFQGLVTNHTEMGVREKIREMLISEQGHGDFRISTRLGMSRFVTRLAAQFSELPGPAAPPPMLPQERETKTPFSRGDVVVKDDYVGVIEDVGSTPGMALVQFVRDVQSEPQFRELLDQAPVLVDLSLLTPSKEIVNLERLTLPEAGMNPEVALRPRGDYAGFSIKGLIQCIGIVIEARSKDSIEAASGSHFVTPQAVVSGEISDEEQGRLRKQIRDIGAYGDLTATLYRAKGLDENALSSAEKDAIVAIELIKSFMAAEGVTKVEDLVGRAQLTYKLFPNGTSAVS